MPAWWNDSPGDPVARDAEMRWLWKPQTLKGPCFRSVHLLFFAWGPEFPNHEARSSTRCLSL
jgi:hypothetical protein